MSKIANNASIVKNRDVKKLKTISLPIGTLQ